MNFSIILPSRKRCKLLRGLLDSISVKTSRLDLVEVFVRIDTDDPTVEEYEEWVGKYKEKIPNLKLIYGARSDNFSKYYYTYMAGISTGKIIWAMNDDCAIETLGWDDYVLSVVGERIDDVFYVDSRDTTRNFNYNGNFACFPMISRKAYYVQGHFFHPEIRCWGADIWLFRVFNNAGLIIDCPDLYTNHYRDHSGEDFNRIDMISKEDMLPTIHQRVDFDYYSKKLRDAANWV